MADPSTRTRLDLPSGTVTFLLTDIEGSTTRWEEAPEAMRTVLGETAFAAAWDEGRAMTLEQAVAHALEVGGLNGEG